MNIDTDKQYREVTIKSVRRAREGWDITDSEGWSLWVTNERCKQAPAVGESIRMYGDGIGRPVRGIAINGRVYRYQTAEEYDSAEKARIGAEKRGREDKAKTDRPVRDARIAKLPPQLQARIKRFHAIKPDFAAEHEPYELFCCEEAAAIADELKTADEIRAFHAAAIDDQRARVPALRLDEHSGNTFGFSCRLAALLVRGNGDHVIKEHGALCPLVGCEEYGCWAAEARA